MLFLPRLALKNALRKPGRSLITASSVVVGVTMIVFGWAFIDGLDSSVVRGQIRSDSGHLRIAAAGHFDKEEEGELDRMIDEAGSVSAWIEELVPEARLHRRLAFAAELRDGRYGLISRGIGVEPERYFGDFALPLEAKLEGPAPAGLEPMWLGAELASSFKARPGDVLTVLARTRAGSYTADDFVVAGLVRSQNPAVDNVAFFVPLARAQELLDAAGAATDIVAFLPSQEAAEPAAARLGPELERRGLAAQTWRERAEPLLQVNRMRRRIFGIVIGIVMLIAASGIANTVVMSCFERIHEIGTLRALGFQTERVVGLLLAESLLIGLAGAAAGALLGAWLVHALEDGLDLSRVTSAGNYSISMTAILYFVLDWGQVLAAFGIGVIVTLASAVAPAVKFARLSPMEAMRR